ncbi:MAG: sigma-70 family RNA polymerase sigma factor [Cytophagales bacterium]|nr:MAG: sigma-70 family RNA polymerase sigma factor [Cytophagales bacterium]TAF59440.1 MAG: sigma-70 family RNA polymerase sigma factor [Cytophagales bacterium]
MTDAEIIIGCKKGDRKAQELLYKQFAPRVMGVCVRYANERNEASDILQEVFISVFEKIGQVASPEALRAWVRKVAVNTAINYYNKNKKSLLSVTYEDTPEAQTQTEDNVLSSLSADELLGVISKLSDGYKMVFNLYVIEGYSHEEIAEQLGISIGTSKSQLARAKALLKQLLTPNYVHNAR